MKSLTKENFWNEPTEYAPSVMDAFCKWIDEYKTRVNWFELFDHYYGPDDQGKSRVKFHDLPIEMQVGIFFQFTVECGSDSSNKLLDNFLISSMQDFVQSIREWFIEEKRFMTREQSAGENFEEQI